MNKNLKKIIIQYYLNSIKSKSKKDFLKNLVNYYFRGYNESFTYLFLKNNEIIKYFINTMDQERVYVCHKKFFDNNIPKTCSCGKSLDDLIKSEVSLIKKLQNYEYFPKLIEYDIENKYYIMENCGKTLKQITNDNVIYLPKNWNNQLAEIDNILEENNMYQNDHNIANICIKDNIIKIIDFGCIHNLEILRNNENFKNTHNFNYENFLIIFTDFINAYEDKIKFI